MGWFARRNEPVSPPAPATAPPTIDVGGDPWPLILVRHARARQYKLRIDPARGTVRLTLPPRASAAAALNWARGQTPWLADQQARQPVIRVGPGCTLMVEGKARIVLWDPARPRAVDDSGDSLVLGGLAGSVGPRLARWLKGRALDVLTRETQALALSADLPLGRVSVGDPRRRWGSCSARGDIRFSWRLILMPVFVRRSIVAHEAAHLVHLNHGPAFHALAQELLGVSPAPADRWLRNEGAALLRLDFSA